MTLRFPDSEQIRLPNQNVTGVAEAEFPRSPMWRVTGVQQQLCSTPRVTVLSKTSSILGQALYQVISNVVTILRSRVNDRICCRCVCRSDVVL